MVATVENPELLCYCRHKKLQHALGSEKCDNCNCSRFRLGSSITEAEAEELRSDGDPTHNRGDMCVTPMDMFTKNEPVDETNRGSADISVTNGEPHQYGGSGLKDSGQRLEFASGMVRDIDNTKPAFDLIIPEGIPYEELMLTRWAELLRKGAIKYSRRNWEKADSDEELERAKASAFRHFMQWFAGETDEDHAAAVFFNINEVETIRFKQKAKESG